MFESTSLACASARRKPLATSLAAIFCLGVSASAVAATAWTVDTCDEANVGAGTIGSLRYAAANAVSGDTIDMSTLTCGTITLATGAVVLAQADVTVNGPGKALLTLSGSNDRVLRHSGTGTLSVNDLSVANGYLHPPLGVSASGGCIASNGVVNLSRVAVHSCHAGAVQGAVRGGGIYAHTGVFAKYSDIAGNVASNSGNVDGGGGGIFTYGYAVLANSTVSGNSAQTGSGGGVRAFGNLVVIASTVSGNSAMIGGGLYANPALNSQSATFELLNSTVSGNLATLRVGGAFTNAGTIHVYNSTVAFNTAGSATSSGSRHYAPGLTISDAGADPVNSTFKAVTLQSSVFSNNTYGTPPVPDDIGVAKFTPQGTNGTPTSGGNNLAFATQWIGLEPRVTTDVCPQLRPLHDNGGPTQTHAPYRGSPAIDAGNSFATGLSPFDQRGAPFARVSGAAADIGAYEVQQGDGIFDNGFDAPPTCM